MDSIAKIIKYELFQKKTNLLFRGIIKMNVGRKMSDKVDYWISEVCYKDNHIDSVRIYKDSNIAYGLEETWAVKSVIDTINNGYNISTMINRKGRLCAGANVEVLT